MFFDWTSSSISTPSSSSSQVFSPSGVYECVSRSFRNQCRTPGTSTRMPSSRAWAPRSWTSWSMSSRRWTLRYGLSWPAWSLSTYTAKLVKNWNLADTREQTRDVEFFLQWVWLNRFCCINKVSCKRPKDKGGTDAWAESLSTSKMLAKQNNFQAFVSYKSN